MKKLYFSICALAITVYANAQTDTAKKFRFSGIQLDGMMLGNSYPQTSREQFQKFVYDNELLNRDLTGYSVTPRHVTIDLNSNLSLRAFAGVKIFRRLHTEVYAGLRFGSATIAAAGYQKTLYDTTGTYINPANGAALVTVRQSVSSFDYSIQVKQLTLPVGFNFCGNKNRRVWFTVGFELAPGITFASQFLAYHTTSFTDLVLTPGSSYNNYVSSSSFYKNIIPEVSSKSLKGIGFVGHASLPASVNLRLSKKKRFFKHTNLTATLAPAMYVAKNKFSGATDASFVVNIGLGLRYNW